MVLACTMCKGGHIVLGTEASEQTEVHWTYEQNSGWLSKNPTPPPLPERDLGITPVLHSGSKTRSPPPPPQMCPSPEIKYEGNGNARWPFWVPRGGCLVVSVVYWFIAGVRYSVVHFRRFYWRFLSNTVFGGFIYSSLCVSCAPLFVFEFPASVSYEGHCAEVNSQCPPNSWCPSVLQDTVWMINSQCPVGHRDTMN